MCDPYLCNARPGYRNGPWFDISAAVIQSGVISPWLSVTYCIWKLIEIKRGENETRCRKYYG